MTVSSGSSPKAFVLSNYRTSDSCTGQHLFRFDPFTFSSAAHWIKKTLGTTNCGHLGLVFGRSEVFLYSFSWYNGHATVSLLDLSVNSIWQYSTPDGDKNYSNMIKYHKIDTLTDMVIATSGYDYINYNRIISSKDHPYSVLSSQTFRDPTPSTTRKLYALYIKD